MSWCPKCKLEYVAGKTNCVECGTELIDELPDVPEFVSFMETKKERLASKFVEFLHYSNIDSATYSYDEQKQQWIVLIDETTLKQVTKLYNAFYSVETDQQLSGIKRKRNGKEKLSNESEEPTFEDGDMDGNTDEDTDFDWDSDNEPSDNEFDESSDDEYNSMFDEEEIQELYDNSKKKPIKPTTYVKKEEQYKDLKSSAFTFLLVSILGIVVLVLNAIGIIGIFEGPMPYIVMGSLFVAFLYVGVSSYLKAQKVVTEVDEENRVTEAINNWLSQNVTAEQLNSFTKSEDSEEIRFFHKLEKMKDMINTQFGELDENYLDRLVEEFYNNNFELNQ